MLILEIALRTLVYNFISRNTLQLRSDHAYCRSVQARRVFTAFVVTTCGCVQLFDSVIKCVHEAVLTRHQAVRNFMYAIVDLLVYLRCFSVLVRSAITSIHYAHVSLNLMSSYVGFLLARISVNHSFGREN